MILEFHPNEFNFVFDTYFKNGEKDQKSDPELVHKRLIKQGIKYSHLLNHFFEVEGYQFYLRLIPEHSTLELALIGLPKNEPASRYLMASQGETRIPLAGFNFVYTLEKNNNDTK